MAISKLPRLAVNWFSQPEQFRRYWDQFAMAIEDLRGSFALLSTSVDELNPPSKVVADLPSTPTLLREIVTDATTTVFADIVLGGGTNTVPVYFDGTDWRIG